MTFSQNTSRTTLGLVLTASAIGLGGCTELGTLGATGNPYSINSTVDASNQINALDDRLDATPFTTGSQLPTTGSATYYGMAYMNDTNAATDNTTDPVFYYGLTQVNASFSGAGTVSGVANNFIDGNNNLVDGELTFTSDQIDRGTAAEFTATVAGSIEPASGGSQNFTGLQLDSGFAGPNAEFVAGSGTNTILLNNGTQAVEFTFGFIAEQ